MNYHHYQQQKPAEDQTVLWFSLRWATAFPEGNRVLLRSMNMTTFRNGKFYDMSGNELFAPSHWAAVEFPNDPPPDEYALTKQPNLNC